MFRKPFIVRADADDSPSRRQSYGHALLHRLVGVAFVGAGGLTGPAFCHLRLVFMLSLSTSHLLLPSALGVELSECLFLVSPALLLGVGLDLASEILLTVALSSTLLRLFGGPFTFLGLDLEFSHLFGH